MMERDIENQIDDMESQAEVNASKETELIFSLEEIDKMLSSLENDPELSRAVQSMKDVRQRELVETEGKLEELSLQGQRIWASLEQKTMELAQVKEKVDLLASLGEDVSETNALLSQRQDLIINCTMRLMEIAPKIEERNHSYIMKDMVSDLGSNLEKGGSLDGLSKGELLGLRRMVRQSDESTEVASSRMSKIRK